MRYEQERMELIHTAHTKARELGHSYVGSIHLLLYGKGTADLPLPQGLSSNARQILQGAGKEAARRKERRIRPEHILMSLTRREQSEAAQLLHLSGIDANELFTRTLENMHWETSAPVTHKKEGTKTKLLDQFSEDLIAKAASMDPVIAREKEIDMVIGILCRKNKNNPALVGEPGVG